MGTTLAVLESNLPELPRTQGKVRDIYDLGDALLIVCTDRISAFDWVLPTGIPDKGRVLCTLSGFWFEFLNQPHHLVSQDPAEFGLPSETDLTPLIDRAQLVRKANVVPVECVARGYLAGSGWKEYQQSQTVCGIPLPAGLVLGDRLPEAIFTPATKATSGHDENISFETMADLVGRELAETLRERTLAIYSQAAQYALERGIIIADTKFEFGQVDGQLLLIDEVLTPDSSRFWPVASYQPGSSPLSYDKQFVRDWLESTSWDKNSTPPPLPDDIVQKTRAKYIEAYEVLSGQQFPWK